MATGKIATVTFRIEPRLKAALRSAAEHDHRSIANMVEVLILDYCERNGITIPKYFVRTQRRKKRAKN